MDEAEPGYLHAPRMVRPRTIHWQIQGSNSFDIAVERAQQRPGAQQHTAETYRRTELCTRLRIPGGPPCTMAFE